MNTSKALISLIALFWIACNSNDPQPDDPSTRKTTTGVIETIAGRGPNSGEYSGDDGLAVMANLGWVTDVAVDASGNLYISDGAANTIRKINDTDGKIKTIGGRFIGYNVPNPTPYTGDGGPATSAYFHMPLGVAVDADGNVYIADSGNNVVRQISSSDGKVTTLAGTGQNSYGYSGDGGPAKDAALYIPHHIATDATGNIYFTDAQNNAVRMITKSTGQISTLTGMGPDMPGYSGDNGPATSATLNMPEGIAVDANGNIYIADSGNNAIRKISGGIITTVAGTGKAGYSGDGGPAALATFSAIKGIAVDKDGNIYVADAGNNAIRKIGMDGKIETLAGDGTEGYSGDGGPADLAKLHSPWGVSVDAEGNVYIADSGNAAVRKVIQ